MAEINPNSAFDFASIGLGSTSETGQAASTAGESAVGQDDFLTLMMAQLKNQDPMSPQDSSEFTSQMAQFSMVDGIQSLQDSFSSVASSLQSNQALQASALVGRKVEVPTSTGQLAQGQPLNGIVKVDTSVSDLKVNIYDSAGTLVNRIDLGIQGSGEAAFSWDGKNADGEEMPAGEYRVVAEATVDGSSHAMTTLMQANVDSVSFANQGNDVIVNLAGVGAMNFKDVTKIQ